MERSPSSNIRVITITSSNRQDLLKPLMIFVAVMRAMHHELGVVNLEYHIVVLHEFLLSLLVLCSKGYLQGLKIVLNSCYSGEKLECLRLRFSRSCTGYASCQAMLSLQINHL